MRLRPDTQNYQNYIDQASHIVANSLFLLFLLLIIDVIICIGLLTGGDLSQLSMSQIGLLAVLCIPVAGLFWKLLRTDPSKWVKGSRRIVWVFTNPIFNLIVTAFVLEICLFTIYFDNHFTAGQSSVSTIVTLIGFWLALVWLMMSYPLLLSLINHPIWAFSTLAVFILLIVVGTAKGNQEIMRRLNYLQRIETGQKFFLGDDLQPYRTQFWTEHFSIFQPMVPYLGHRSTAFDGDFININTQGIRKSVELPEYVEESGDITIHFYGGSTLWGFGARDNYTIPSFVSRILQREYEINSQVTNFGELGYNSLNDKNLFDIQILQGNMPNIVIFYQGYNDIVLGSMKAGYIGASPQSVPLGSIPLEDSDAMLDYYARYTKTLQAVAQAHNFTAIFVWQPTWIHKSLTTYEAYYIPNSNLANAEAVRDYYEDINPKLEALMEDSTIEHFLFLSDLFAEQTETIFIDVVHITEDGNQQVAKAIVDYLFENNLVEIKE